MLTKKMQEIIDALNADRQGVLAAIAGLTDAQLGYRTADDQWSISNILHHLALVEEGNLKLFAMMTRKAEESNAAPDPSPDGSVIDCVDQYREILLDRKNRITAPDRVNPQTPLAAAEGLARLQASREKVIAAAEQLGRYDLSLLKWPHPLLGELHLYQWLLFVGQHEKRHTAQIEEIKSNPNFPK